MRYVSTSLFLMLISGRKKNEQTVGRHRPQQQLLGVLEQGQEYHGGETVLAFDG